MKPIDLRPRSLSSWDGSAGRRVKPSQVLRKAMALHTANISTTSMPTRPPTSAISSP